MCSDKKGIISLKGAFAIKLANNWDVEEECRVPTWNCLRCVELRKQLTNDVTSARAKPRRVNSVVNIRCER